MKILETTDYRVVAHAASRLEAEIVIDRLCGRFMRERPGVALLSVHDSLLSTREHIEEVRTALLDEFATFGIRPTIRGK